jgi:hypothetical protein
MADSLDLLAGVIEDLAAKEKDLRFRRMQAEGAAHLRKVAAERRAAAGNSTTGSTNTHSPGSAPPTAQDLRKARAELRAVEAELRSAEAERDRWAALAERNRAEAAAEREARVRSWKEARGLD